MYLNKGPVRPGVVSRLIAKACEKPNTGGHSLFLGRVRADIINGKSVKAIEYFTYDEMVTVGADKIKAAVHWEFSDIKSVDILHSKGIVKAGEVSLVVLISAGHRHHAMQACAKTVEMIKERLPVWGKELFEDGTYHWRHNDQPSEQD